MKVTSVIFLVTLFWSSFTFAEERDHFFRLFLNTPLQGVEFYQGEDTAAQARFLPNAQVLTSFTIGYKEIYLGFSLKGASEAPEKGETSYTNYRFAINRHKFAINAYFQQYEGFYLENPQKSDGGYYSYGDFRSKNFGITTAYYFSKDFNRGSETIEFHRLLQDLDGAYKKDSSWFFKIGYDDNKIENVPQDDTELQEESASDFIEMTGGEFKTVTFAFGLDFYYIFYNWFVDTKFSIGPGFQRQNFSSRGEAIEKSETSTIVELELSLGYQIGNNVISLSLESQRIESDLQFKRGFTSSGEVFGLSFSKAF